MLAPISVGDPKSSEAPTASQYHHSQRVDFRRVHDNGSLDRVAQRLKPLGPFGHQLRDRPAPNFNALPPPHAAAAIACASMNQTCSWFSRSSAQTSHISKFNWIAMVGAPLAAILFQVYVPRFITYLSYLELPLLVTVYFPLMRRSPVMGVFFGAGVGLAQDSLCAIQPSLGDVWDRKNPGRLFRRFRGPAFRSGENSGVRLVLAFFFYFFHQFLSWVLTRALLGQNVDFRFSANSGAGSASQRGGRAPAVSNLG